jgi:formate dehydrogenase maturation protein FdhE
MITVLSALLVVGTALFVAWPFLRHRDDSTSSRQNSFSPLERQKLEAYAAIKEAEFDLRMGKLSEEDFCALEQKYRQQALAAIAALEESKRVAKLERRAEEPKVRRIAYCPACGQRVPPRANFCGGCGCSLGEKAA